MTAEYSVGSYTSHLTALDHLLGDGEHHLARLAATVGDHAEVDPLSRVGPMGRPHPIGGGVGSAPPWAVSSHTPGWAGHDEPLVDQLLALPAHGDVPAVPALRRPLAVAGRERVGEPGLQLAHQVVGVEPAAVVLQRGQDVRAEVLRRRPAPRHLAGARSPGVPGTRAACRTRGAGAFFGGSTGGAGGRPCTQVLRGRSQSSQ